MTALPSPAPTAAPESAPTPPPSIAAAVACSSPGCGQPASLACPTCIKLGLAPPARFCSQPCFKSSWKAHNSVHKQHEARLSYVPPPFNYTGPLRPQYVSPMRTVPVHIARPDYAISGIPAGEMKMRGSSTIHINTAAEIAGIREACRIGRLVLDYAHSLIQPGVTGEEIDLAVHEKVLEYGAYPSPLNYHEFPKSVCISVNEVICHGIPDARALVEGDIVNIDVSVYYGGFHGDLNETYSVGKIDAESKKLIRATYDCMHHAIEAARPGTYCRDFGDIIQRHANKHGLSVVKTYCGHGVGALFHCAPNIPHYARNKAVGQLKPGMVLSIEPMINVGTWRDVTWPDNWTSTTADGKRSAQFEHTILITETGYDVLTARTKDSPPLPWEKGNLNYSDDDDKLHSDRSINGSGTPV